MKSTKLVVLVFCIFLVCSLSMSCTKNTSTVKTEKTIEYRNEQMIKDFNTKEFLPKNTGEASIPDNGKSWTHGDIDGDMMAEVLMTFQYQNTPLDQPTLGAILFKQEEGIWVKKYEFRENAKAIAKVQFCDFTGDNQVDLVIGWETDPKISEKHFYLYRWNQKNLESVRNFFCTKLQMDDYEGIYGKDGQYEFGIWKQTERTLSIDILRWNASSSLSVLFPTEYGKMYSQEGLSRAEDLEENYHKNFVIPELTKLAKDFPNEALYDIALIQAYIKAKMTTEALNKISSSEGTLYTLDQEKIPFLKAQIYFQLGEILKGNSILEKELSKSINRVDAGTTIQQLGRVYMNHKEWDKANLAFQNALIFHRSFTESEGFDAENQFQFSLAKDKARLEIKKQFYDLRKNISNPDYKNYFQSHLVASKAKSKLPNIDIFEFYLSFNSYTEPYATVISWKDKGRDQEIILMAIDEDQHKITYNFSPINSKLESYKSGWKLWITFQEKTIKNNQLKEFTKIVLWEKNNYKLINAPD